MSTYKIVITEEGGTFRYEQLVQELNIKAIYDLVNKKPRVKRSDSGVKRQEKSREELT